MSNEKLSNEALNPPLRKGDVIWRCLSEETPLANRIIEIEVDSQFWQTDDKTIITKTLSHGLCILIRIDGDGGFFRAKPVGEFNQSLQWRYNDI
jgi:hypothetical protein